MVPPEKDSAIARAQVRRQRLDGRAQPAWERRALAEAKHGACRGEAGETAHQRV